MIKIFANLCIIYIIMGKYEESKDINENAIQVILGCNQDS